MWAISLRYRASEGHKTPRSRPGAKACAGVAHAFRLRSNGNDVGLDGVLGQEAGTPSPSAMKRRTFLHGSVPVEREFPKPGERVSRGGDTPLDRWVQGERSLPLGIKRRNVWLARIEARCRGSAISRRGCNGERAAGSPCQDAWYYHAHLAQSTIVFYSDVSVLPDRRPDHTHSNVEKIGANVPADMQHGLNAYKIGLLGIEDIMRLVAVTAEPWLDLERCRTDAGESNQQVEARFKPGSVSGGLLTPNISSVNATIWSICVSARRESL